MDELFAAQQIDHVNQRVPWRNELVSLTDTRMQSAISEHYSAGTFDSPPNWRDDPYTQILNMLWAVMAYERYLWS